MPLLVVPLAAEESDHLTLREYDRLRACTKVLFEDPAHPLMSRLIEEGIAAGPFDDEPAADADTVGLVAAPDSPRIVELARLGAEVTAGPSSIDDPLTAAHGAYVLRRAQASLGELVAVMARLRSDDGCPWDREQTHASLVPHLLEEAQEVLEAIEAGDVGEQLEDELGDILLQVAFHAEMAAREERFDVAGVGTAIVTKLVRRHPHVFAGVQVSGPDEVIRNWNEIKAEEKKLRRG
ncbi:MAG: nucleoside triphosphate pyrophosphohydrolase [Actinomycetota bacterium]|nr:nucleoside triphosphate pyrophosphohydrolase [Actinomycetota bacterium]